jgi:hypothetical protein
MSNVTRFTVCYPANLTEPILDVDGDELRLIDATCIDGRRLDLEQNDPAEPGKSVYLRLDEERARVLRDRLTAWLDAPAAGEASPS